LLLYAVDESSAFHRASRHWLEQSLTASETVAFDWTVLLAFVRLSTRAAIFEHPLKPAQALDIVEGWLAQSNVIVVHPTDRHAAILRDLLNRLGTGGNITSDAHLAAIAIEHGADLYSMDSDFSRFPGLHWIDPLSQD
jgi:toxin-antitoxin system PIN domain toxin